MAHESGKVLGLGLIIALTGCRSIDTETAWHKPRPLGADIVAYRPPSEECRSATPALEIEEPSGDITLRRALVMALMKNPEMAAVSWQVRASEARALQEGLLPNPEIEVEVEDFDSTGTGFDTAETTITLSQLVELGGKRRKRMEVAKLESGLAGWNYEAKRLAVFTETTKAFVNVLASQERVVLAESSAKLAKDVFQVVTERVKAGKVSPLEQTRAKVTLSTSQIELKRSKQELDVARKQLVAMWGGESPRFSTVKGEFEAVINKIPPIAELLPHVLHNPDIAIWETAVRLKESAVALEEAGRLPDLTTSAGIQRFEETGDDAFKFGLSLPLPLFDRNQGSIREARYLVSKARAEQKATDVDIRKELAEVYQELLSSHLTVFALRNEVMPAAQRAFEGVRDGYQQGKFGYLEVLDAQRTLFEARGLYVGSLTAYHEALAEIEGLLGNKIERLGKTQNK